MRTELHTGHVSICESIICHSSSSITVHFPSVWPYAAIMTACNHFLRTGTCFLNNSTMDKWPVNYLISHQHRYLKQVVASRLLVLFWSFLYSELLTVPDVMTSHVICICSRETSWLIFRRWHVLSVACMDVTVPSWIIQSTSNVVNLLFNSKKLTILELLTTAGRGRFWRPELHFYRNY